MQQHFRLLIFLIQPYMFRAINSPILSSTFWLYVQLLVQCTGRQQCWCIIPKVIHIVKKVLLNLSPETCRAELKRLLNEKVVASCWLFTSSLNLHFYTQFVTTPTCFDPTWSSTESYIKSLEHYIYIYIYTYTYKHASMYALCLKMMRIDRNTSEVWQIVCKNIQF